MSVVEIIKELPKLSEADRRAVRATLLEIANANPEIAACNQSADDAAKLMDRMEDDDAGNQSR